MPFFSLFESFQPQVIYTIKGSTGRSKKITHQTERKIIETVYDSQQSSTRGLALQGLRVSYENIRNVIENHKYSSSVARIKPLLSVQNVKKRLRFANQHVWLPPEYWDDVIFSDVMKIMLGLYI